jgi:nucleoside-diphosphate-sugar epimerase
MRVLIVGCGYVGLPLGETLVQQGHEVFGLRRTLDGAADLEAVGIKPLAADICQSDQLVALPGPFDWVVNLVSSGKGGSDAYQQVFLDGTRNLVAWLRSQPTPPKKFVYTSSTSVYGQTDGSVVKESSPTAPDSATSKLLVETESVLAEAAKDGFPAVVLRVAGIYGPDRGHLFRKFCCNEARLEGKGDRIINMIHRDDVVGCLVAALKSGRPGEIYNAVDDEPVAQIHFFRWLAETLGKHMPPAADAAEMAERKRGLTNKKVSNRRLKMEVGVQLRYPTFRQGYTAEIKRLEDAGQLELAPDQRL